MIDKEKLRALLMRKHMRANTNIEDKGKDNNLYHYYLGQASATAKIITKLDAGEFDEEVQNER
jgi:hypothetical protein